MAPTLLDVVRRTAVARPWAEGEKIPWSDPDFSERMLREHLRQAHDAASRRAETIDRQVAWLHGDVLGGCTTRVLDIACGPGLYSERLAKLGHTCVGVDYAPASIAYARARAAEAGLACSYVEADVRRADWGRDFGLAMWVHGEFNVFTRDDARALLERARASLAPGGALVVEAHTRAAVRELGSQGRSWYSADGGLFTSRPHLCLEEAQWDDERSVATTRYFIVDAEDGSVERHAASVQAYTDAEYRSLLASCGFQSVELLSSLTGDADASGPYTVLRARAP